MNQCGSDAKIWCYLHPTEMVVGICALCLNEKLLVLASKQAQLNQTHSPLNTASPRKSPIPLPKIFSLTNLLNRLDIVKPTKAGDDHDVCIHLSSCSSTTSAEDSFISIKFEENGAASWDSGTRKKSHDLCSNGNWDKAKNAKSVVEHHAKPRATMRWRRRIGHIFQVVRRKRPSKGNVRHAGTKLETTKLKYGWVRTLTKRTRKDRRGV